MTLKEIEKRLKNGEPLATLLVEYDFRLTLSEVAKRLKYRGSLDKLRKEIRKEQLKKEWQTFKLKYLEKTGKNIGFVKFKRLREKAFCIIGGFKTGYSMGDLRSFWIDGVPIAELDGRIEYRGGKWSAKHGYLNINMTLQELSRIENINGVWTIKYPSFRAKWLEQKGEYANAKVVWHNGYCVGTSHADTKRDALLLEVLKRREMRLKNRIFIGVDDFKKLGACSAGIKSFLRKIDIDPKKIGGVTIGYLEELAKEKGAYEDLYPYIKRFD